MTAEEFKYTNYMTLEEWKQFKENYYNDEDSKDEPIKIFLERMNNDSFYNLINISFTWWNTPQHHTYWEMISKRTEPVIK